MDNETIGIVPEAQVVKEDTPETRAGFRVSVIGTGSKKSEHDENAIALAGGLAATVIRDGHKIVTGGYKSGIMGAVSIAAQEEARILERPDLQPEGVTLGHQLGERSQEANITEVETLQQRLKDLIDQSNAVVVLHGKTGTVVELLNALWSYAIERLKGNGVQDFVSKPIIIADSSLEHTDLLAYLKGRDTSKFSGAMKDVYIIGPSGFETPEGIGQTTQTINQIIELYYRMSLGKELIEDEKESLRKLSLEEFLKQQEHFSDGSGI